MQNALGYTEQEVKAAWDWMENYANEIGGEYDDHHYSTSANELLDYADSHVTSTGWGGDYLVMGGLLEGERVSDEFWDKYEIIRGVRVNNRNNFFSCSC